MTDEWNVSKYLNECFCSYGVKNVSLVRQFSHTQGEKCNCSE